ncbi:MAG: type 3 dihydrofolate reductase [Bacteroidota bacterium]
MTTSAIVAISNNRVIGNDNDIPWYLPADLKYFKRRTLNHHIIMGRKTFQSIGRPLPKRTNIVLTRDMFFAATNCLIAHSLEHALTLAKDNGETEAFIIGGGQIYEMALPLLDKIYLTEVDVEVEGDVVFPFLPPNEWVEVSAEAHRADEKNAHDYVFKVFERVED